jgi:tRNA threonylcarbamoyladenosine biosynthesis protein TsaE
MYEITTTSSQATKDVARQLAGWLRGGEVIELVSDLGGGKTTFVQGLAAGLGYTLPVTSPTFTLSNIYELRGGRELHHYDLYRLSEAGILAEELEEDMTRPNIMTIIEWACVASDKLPADHLTIRLEPIAQDARSITMTSGGPISERLVKAMSS